MEGQTKARGIFRRILKIVGWIFLSIVLLLIVVAVAIQLPPVQNKIVHKAVTFLEKKIGTKVSLDHISISFPKAIVLEGLYLEDQKKDTLLYAGKFSVDTDLWALTHHEIQLNEINLENCRAYISRAEADSAYNFSYILKAFAGDSTEVKDTTTSGTPWTFSIEDVRLTDIKAKYHDLLTGNLADLDLGDFELSLKDFDLDQMKIIVDEITLKNTQASFIQTKQPEVTEEVAEEKQPFTYDIGVGRVNLENVHGVYDQQALGEMMRLDLGESELVTEKVDLKVQNIALKSFLLHNTFLSYQKHPVKVKTAKQQVDPEPTSEKKVEKQAVWKMSLGELDLKDNSIQYYDFNKPVRKNAIDFDHLWLTSLDVALKDLMVNGSLVKCTFDNLSFREKSGFAVNTFKGTVDLKEKGIDIDKLSLITSNSRFNFDGRATFTSLEDLSKNLSQTKFIASVSNTSIGLRDLLYFNPTLKDSLPITLSASSRIYVDANANGAVGNLKIRNLQVKALDKTILKTSGTIKGLPDATKLQMNIYLDKFYTTRNDIENILPDTLLPDSIAIPDWVNIHGAYAGGLKKANFKTLLTSTSGNVSANGKFDLDSLSATRGIDVHLTTERLDLGEIMMNQKTFGLLDLEAKANLQGLNVHEMNGVVKTTIKSFTFQGYTYKDFLLDGKVANSLYSGVASLHDPNLDFALQGELNYREEVPSYNITFDLKNADFKALHVAERPLKARGILTANVATDDFKVINGNFGIRKVAIFNGDAFYAVDSLLFASLDQEGRSELKIDSDLLSARFEGSFNVFTLPDVLKKYFGTYYALHDTSLVANKDEGPQHFKFELQLKKTELLTDILLPELTSFVPGKIRGDFNSAQNRLDMEININDIQYSKIGLKSFVFKINSNPSKLNYDILADEIRIDSLKIDGLEFTGTVADNRILTDLAILDSADRKKYLFGALLHSLEHEYELKLLPDQVILNYADWKVPQDNYVRFGGPKLVANNLTLTNGREQIILDSKDDAASTLFVGFRELNLEYLVSMVSREKFASGLLHGDIYIVPDTANMSFTADLGIKDLNITDIPWGDVSFSVARKIADRFDVKFRLQSDRNDISANGYFINGEKSDINVTAQINKFDLATVEPLTMGQLKDLKGSLTGKILVKGSSDQPSIDGNINLQKVAFLSTYVNTPFTIEKETISLNDRGIGFDTFEVRDNRNNTAVLDGLIETADYKKFAFRLNLQANDFRILNTTEKDNDMFYGKVDINATVRIRGDMNEPTVDAKLGLSDGSNFTYVVPQSDASVMEAEGIVRFVDKTFKNDPFMKSVNIADTAKSSFTGLNLTAEIDLNDKSAFKVIIDPTTGDQLAVKGNTTLTINMDPTGNLELSGRYEITEGTYNLSFYKFLKREFKIDKGSTMTWSGDPLNAQMDIAAIFEVETAPIDLMSAQLDGSDQTEQNKYKQKLPFQVYLNIGGQLLKPDIKFKIDMPESARNYMGGNVYSMIQDINTREADLNKQVFALLILKRFISDNPLENQGATGLEGTARSSVSKILTDQLNRLGQNIRGVELSFDVKSGEDYSSGQAQGQTQLQLGLSKNLFNDRLVVKVAGNVDVEGGNAGKTQEMTDYIGDLALEYKLTEDGRFRITGFRNSNYDMIDGELTDTGAGLIYIKDYNLLGELFKANAKEKKK